VFTVKDVTDSKYALPETLMTIIIFYVFILYVHDMLNEEDDSVLDE